MSKNIDLSRKNETITMPLHSLALVLAIASARARNLPSTWAIAHWKEFMHAAEGVADSHTMTKGKGNG